MKKEEKNNRMPINKIISMDEPLDATVVVQDAQIAIDTCTADTPESLRSHIVALEKLALNPHASEYLAQIQELLSLADEKLGGLSLTGIRGHVRSALQRVSKAA